MPLAVYKTLALTKLLVSGQNKNETKPNFMVLSCHKVFVNFKKKLPTRFCLRKGHNFPSSGGNDYTIGKHPAEILEYVYFPGKLQEVSKK